MSEYQVGQVLYVLDSARQRIIPIQVVSETVRKTLSGSEFSYEVVSPAKKDQPVSMSKLVGEVYTSLQEIEQFLRDNALSAISSIVTKAQTAATQSFDVMFDSPDSAVTVDSTADDDIFSSAVTVIKQKVMQDAPAYKWFESYNAQWHCYDD